MINRSQYTIEEIQFVKDNFHKKPYNWIAKQLGCSKTKINGIIKRFNLERTPEEIESFKNHFPKGHVPANKGIKGQRVSIETEFTKGNQPHNTKYDGCITVRKDSKGNHYQYIRISKGKWQEYHRYLWEQHNGAIPKGMIICFKDGDQMNVVLENLEMITQAENARRNKNIFSDKCLTNFIAGYNAPEDLKNEIIKNKDLLKLKKHQLILRRKLKNGKSSQNQDAA